MADDPKYSALEVRIDRLENEIRRLRGCFADASGRSPRAPRIASDAEMDGPAKGDPSLKKDPPRWKGRSYAGLPFSRCPPDYLDEVADFRQWCSDQEGASSDPAKRKFAPHSARLAALARGWAARHRKTVPPPEAPAFRNPYEDSKGEAHGDSSGRQRSDSQRSDNANDREDIPF